MADPLVDEWHSRDLDSRISEREVSAVVDWLATGKHFHVMRDRPNHRHVMEGCCFGMKIPENNIRIKYSSVFKKGSF